MISWPHSTQRLLDSLVGEILRKRTNKDLWHLTHPLFIEFGLQLPSPHHANINCDLTGNIHSRIQDVLFAAALVDTLKPTPDHNPARTVPL